MNQKTNQLRENHAGDRNFTGVTSTEIEQNEASSNETAATNAAMVFWLFFLFVLVGISIFTRVSEILTNFQKKMLLIQTVSIFLVKTAL